MSDIREQRRQYLSGRGIVPAMVSRIITASEQKWLYEHAYVPDGEGGHRCFHCELTEAEIKGWPGEDQGVLPCLDQVVRG